MSRTRRTEQVTITASSLRLLRACQRAYDLRYRQGIASIRRAPALALGSAIHAGLEAWWRGRLLSEDDRLADALEAARRWAADHAGDVEPADQMRVDAMLSMYHARWIGSVNDYETIGVEIEYAAPVVAPNGKRARGVERRGKIDGLVREVATNRIYILEHKTTSEQFGPGSAYVERLMLDSQISHYMAGARALGYEAAGALYDVLGKPAARKLATPPEARRYTKTGELYAAQRADDEDLETYYARICDAMASDPDAYFRRMVVVRTERELTEAQADDWAMVGQIRNAATAGYWPRNPDSCLRYGARCDYWAICSGQSAADDVELYQIRRPHAELSQKKTRRQNHSADAPECSE